MLEAILTAGGKIFGFITGRKKSKLETRKLELETFQAELDLLHNFNKSLTSNMARMEQEVEKMNSINLQLVTEVGKLRKENFNLTIEVSKLRASERRLTQQVAMLTQENEQLLKKLNEVLNNKNKY